MLKEKGYFIFVLYLLMVLFSSTGCQEVPGSNSNAEGQEYLRVHFIDVGQGDSILIQTPANREAILIDGGSREAEEQVVNYLQQQGVKKINLLIVTHPHEDHLGGLLKVLQLFPVEKIIDSGKRHNTSTYRNYLKTVLEKKIPLEVAKDQSFTWEGGSVLQVLGPVRKDYEEVNDYSVVTKLVYGKIAFLFTGDMEKEAERDLLAQDLSATILKVGHHGSRSSTSAQFLRQVKPEAAIISLGANNDYGHPHKITLKKLDKSKVKVYRTDLQGSIEVITDGNSYWLETEK